MNLPVSIGGLRRLIKELQAAGDDRRPIAIGGAAELSRTLERELTRGGDPSAVRIGAPAGAAVYLHIATGDDEAALKGARRQKAFLSVKFGSRADRTAHNTATTCGRRR